MFSSDFGAYHVVLASPGFEAGVAERLRRGNRKSVLVLDRLEILQAAACVISHECHSAILIIYMTNITTHAAVDRASGEVKGYCQ